MFGKLWGLDYMYRRRRIESDEKKMIYKTAKQTGDKRYIHI